jgi:hypothetical protein
MKYGMIFFVLRRFFCSSPLGICSICIEVITDILKDAVRQAAFHVSLQDDFHNPIIANTVIIKCLICNVQDSMVSSARIRHFMVHRFAP